MHLRRFSHLPEDKIEKIRESFDAVKQKFIVPSMRSLQFGGLAIEAKHERIYNCAAGHVDSLRSFAEGFYLLLCGVGVTFGLNEKYLSRLPDLVSKKIKLERSLPTPFKTL